LLFVLRKDKNNWQCSYDTRIPCLCGICAKNTRQRTRISLAGNLTMTGSFHKYPISVCYICIS